MTSLIVVDDHDPQINYEGNWIFDEPGVAGTQYEYQETDARSNRTGDTATFTFTGIWVSVYGTTGDCFNPTLPRGNFSIDGGEPFQFEAPSITNISVYYQMFYSAILPEGSHTLQFTRVGPDTTCDLVLDFIEYIPSVPQNTTTGTSTSSQGVSVSVLAGSIAGGVGGVILFLALGLLLRRYQVVNQRKQDMIDELIAARSRATLPEERQAGAAETPPHRVAKRFMIDDSSSISPEP
ncbi:hypothetical protein CONPUDRAFT_139015 [Coniophora puteana RWD-64-598 SS2]|uniref:Uncharacterized protein n=1 Tax=Coniophora puteana (strain RWD-64-598) TaxID=741705 RepID=A0A5M3MFP0_CONPW|nr:uncharacterized protein CONPUDRAFT_139015 [Coniophora puteana RWD-64-598 SS2]EIW77857.1 hypothetical protein CONPUDRAFT_139015 [Coniophora puteana RWD-64-598 SS2]